MSSSPELKNEKYQPFQLAVKSFEHLLYICRDDDLQKNAIVDLETWLVVIAGWKREARDCSKEDEANYCLGLECICKFYQSELKMWLLLKERNPDEAWRNLVSAQTSITNVVRAHVSFSEWQYHVDRLQTIERTIFPPQQFVSMGLYVKRQICTICQTEYEDCPHLVGIPYWGEFCWRIIQDFTPDHLALVEKPANKGCRIICTHLEEGKRNQMTWRVEPYSAEEREKLDAESDGREGRTFTASLIAVDDLTV